MLLEEDIAEHLVADQDGRLRFRYSHDAAAAALEAMAAPVGEPQGGRVPGAARPRRALRASSLRRTPRRPAAALRRCRVEVVPGGHVPLWDALAETGALVKDFVAVPTRA